jgi:branched-subunit amino acid aminotransferase/4-amino-4-deoxychorismate lyase
MKVYFGNSIVPEQDAAVSVFDHGLLYETHLRDNARIHGIVFMEKNTAEFERSHRSTAKPAKTLAQLKQH